MDRFNEGSDAEAVRELYACFASQSWAERVAAGRPYANFESLWGACEAAWSGLAPADWLGAFAAHPRIGERGGHASDSSPRAQNRGPAAPRGTLGELADEKPP